MKIAIVNNHASFLEFFVNLAKYLELQGNEVVFLSPDSFIKRVIVKYTLKYDNYEDLTFTDSYYDSESPLVKYFRRLFNVNNIQKLVNQKNTEFFKAKKYLSDNKFDYVLIFNGALNVETDVCKELGLKTFFFEQGYFPNTIQMDGAGVNCNTTFSNLQLSDFMQFKYTESVRDFNRSYTIIKVSPSLFQRYFYRLLDFNFLQFFLSFLTRKRNLAKAKRKFKKVAVETIDFNSFGKYIFFPLQVNSDTQIILNSKYSSMYEAIEDVLPALKKTGLKVILKEHPFEVEPVDYSGFVDNENVFLVAKTDIDKLIENSEFVVNINSSVGFQAIAKYKKVLILGNSFYDNSPCSIKFSEVTNNDIIYLFNKINLEKTIINSYLDKYRKDVFIEGHFYSLTVKMLEDISKRLV